MTPIAFDRATMLGRLAGETFDVLVVGGGITGVGVALDAASRGLRTALIDKGDLASGTSSKSSKLIHGGLRYLQQREVVLVYEALAERQRLRKLAPHLVRTLPFLIPILTKDGVVPPKVARAMGMAMWGYDLTGGARIGKVHQRLTKDEALAHLPTMPAERLASAYLYYDARADDARLCLAVARTAAAHGAAIATYATLRGLGKDSDGRVTSASVEADGERFDVRCRTVVNATGVWADEVRALDEGQDPDSIRPAKGIHITVPWSKVQADIAVVIPVPKDRRSLFIVPWGELAYIGTTDTDYDGPLDDPQCTPDDIAYVLAGPELLGDHLGHRARRARHLGRAPAPGQERGERPHGRPVAPAQGDAGTEQRRDRDRRQAHDLSAHGRRHRRRGDGGVRSPRAEPHEPHPARRCRRLRRGRGREPGGPSERPLRQRGAGGRGAAAGRARAGPPTRARAALPGGRGGVRGPPRDGRHPRRHPAAGAPGPACSPGTTPRRRPPRWPPWSARSSAGTTPSEPAR